MFDLVFKFYTYIPFENDLNSKRRNWINAYVSPAMNHINMHLLSQCHAKCTKIVLILCLYPADVL